MTSKRDSTQFLQDILESVNDIEEFVKEMDFKEFSGDKKTIYAVMKALEIMGEAFFKKAMCLIFCKITNLNMLLGEKFRIKRTKFYSVCNNLTLNLQQIRSTAAKTSLIL